MSHHLKLNNTSLSPCFAILFETLALDHENGDLVNATVGEFQATLHHFHGWTTWRGESWGVGKWCSTPGECEGEGSGECEGEGSGEWEGGDVILEGEVKGSVTSSIVGNRATSWPEYPFVGLFVLLKPLLLREGTDIFLE
ncbi:hypothetical protein Tco_0351978 [Tanacetum coccineum]